MVSSKWLYNAWTISDTGKMKVLVVDDDEWIRELFREMLSGYDVVMAESDVKAVESFRRENPDVVLMDIVVGDMDGIEATRRILSENPKAAVFAVICFSETKGEEIIRAVAKEVISKPLKRSDLLSRVGKYAGGRPTQSATGHVV